MTDQSADDVAFPELTDEQLALVSALGERRRVRAGELLFSPDDDHYDWVVVLSGAVEVVGTHDQLITRQDARHFLGEVSLVTRQRPYLSTRVAEAGEVLIVPADVFHGEGAHRSPAERHRPGGVPGPSGVADVDCRGVVADHRVRVHARVDGAA